MDTEACHEHSCNAEEMLTMDVFKVQEYRDKVRAVVLKNIVKFLKAGFENVFLGCLEHEYMHQETFIYLLMQVDPSSLLYPFKESDRKEEICNELIYKQEWIRFPITKFMMGADKKDKTFKWDNEYLAHEVLVEEFEISNLPVLNSEYLKFIENGGYEKEEYWTSEDWDWLCKNQIKNPVLWRKSRDEWEIRTLFKWVELKKMSNHPVLLSYAEAAAYAKSVGARLPTEAEWRCAVFQYSQGKISQEVYESGNIDINLEIANTTVPSGITIKKLVDVLGNGWEWTRTVFEGYPGFEKMVNYPGYSADFFDGKHHVIMGGSWATPEELIRPTFRNWYQRHYRYMFTKMRLVR